MEAVRWHMVKRLRDQYICATYDKGPAGGNIHSRTPLLVKSKTSGGSEIDISPSAGPWSYMASVYWFSSPIPHMLPYNRHPWMSSSTKSTCPTCSQVESHPITVVSPCCQTFTLFIHDQPPSATFTSNHLPPHHSTVCFGYHHLPTHP